MRTRTWIVISTLSLLSVSVAQGEEAGSVEEREQTTTITPDSTTTTTTTPTTTEEVAPAPGTVTPSPANCGPMSYNHANNDYQPGRGKRVTGGMFLGLGLATLIPGAILIAWSQTQDPTADRSQEDLDRIRNWSIAATAVGAASTIIGIPVLAVGVSKGNRERERRLTLLPSLAPTRSGGGIASLGGRF
jgi:hypothetical protein